MKKEYTRRVAFLFNFRALRLMTPLWSVLIAGCMVGPDFKHPVTLVASSWSALSSSQSPEISIPTARPMEMVEWWKSFNDPVLTSLIERGIASNLDLQRASARIRQARAERLAGKASLWPSADAFADVNRTGVGENLLSRASSSGLETSIFQAGLDAAWELDLFGGVRRNVEAFSADLDVAIEDGRDATMTLMGEIGLNYFTLRGLQEQIAIAEANLTAQGKMAEITRQRSDAGFVSRLDVANANAQMASTAARIPLLESGADESIHTLSVLLGCEPSALKEELEVPAPLAAAPPEVPVGLPSDLLRRRPDIRRSEALIHAATARVGVAVADLFPKFSLTGSFSFSGDALSSTAEWNSRSWSVGPGVQWRIFDAGRIRWNIEAREEIREQALLEYRQIVLTALKDVETALTSYAKEQVRRRLLSEAVLENRRAVELASKLYASGQTDFLDVLTAQAALFVAEEAHAQSNQALCVNLTALYKALGGGWERTEWTEKGKTESSPDSNIMDESASGVAAGERRRS